MNTSLTIHQKMNQPMDLLKTSKLIQICDLVWHKHVLQFINITTIDKAVKGTISNIPREINENRAIRGI
ncbi:hypothetical protein V1478_003966 [Vespula squamosa]|uniref:Uncharacterized protein n=1 Tax=Vespula squamosa TaxID=30214 RepID=A0ABD2BPQ4_VESSQ